MRLYRGAMTAERAGIVLGDVPGEGSGDGEPALAVFEGEPMLRTVVGTVADVTDEVVVACRADQRDDFAAALEGLAVRFAVDPEPEQGLIGGLGVALDAVEAPVVAVVAADMPAVDETFLRYLFDRLGGNEAAVPALPDEQLQPAQAVYRTAPAREAAAESLAASTGTLADVVDRLQAGIVPPAEVQQVTAWRSLAHVTTGVDAEGSAIE
jgi:molybdopterin-guanine dinucleotide biosynthesis protein A